MQFSEKWLREWVNPSIDTEALCHQLTMAGLEVDAIEPVAGVFSGIVVGKIVSISPHPDAEKLNICRVDVGQQDQLQIVCGASNVREGMYVPAAVIGALLPGNFKIKKAKLRGVESFGMLCSASELGLAESSDGLLELPELPVGADIRDQLQLDDVSIELGLTPNRSDCLGMKGVAREVAVITRTAVGVQKNNAIEASSDEKIEVNVVASDVCPRYVGRVIKNINTSAETPLWMQERLRRSGLRSLSPIVDITNYVLLELGQPMHAFDLNKIQGGIEVRLARQGEKLQLLNEQEINLKEGNLVIADSQQPLALAGIMGGLASAVDETTTDLFLESAFFTPDCMAGKARAHGLHTDSSHRFERGVDYQLQTTAIERATELVIEVAGGQAGPVVEAVNPSALPVQSPVILRRAQIQRVLGVAIPDEEVVDILSRLDLLVSDIESGWRIEVPSFRFDIALEVDLIEELGRIYGYDNLPTSRPLGALSMHSASEKSMPVARMKAALVDRAYQEAITYSFVDPKIQSLLEPELAPKKLSNPISADMEVMRTSLWAGLIQAVQYNLNRQQDRVRLFESGKKFVPMGGELLQTNVLAAAVSGWAEPEQWGGQAKKVDFFDLKADVEALLALLGNNGHIVFSPEAHTALHPGQSARIYRGENPIGWLGALHPQVEQKLGLAKTFVFEIDMDRLGERVVPSFNELSKFPAIRRDIAVVVDDEISLQQVCDCIRSAAPGYLKDLNLFDVYTGKGIDFDQKSVALGLTLQDDSRTLTDDEVDAAVSAVVKALGTGLGARLRD